MKDLHATGYGPDLTGDAWVSPFILFDPLSLVMYPTLGCGSDERHAKCLTKRATGASTRSFDRPAFC